MRLLLLLTLLIQGAMFFSYPLGAGSGDDNESAQKYYISEYARGNFLVGNVRYSTGYGLVMAPFKTLTDQAGHTAERALLLLQMLGQSAIPFLAYDIMRRRFSNRAALITALFCLADPFLLQWSHFQLPGWLIGLSIVTALWLAGLAWHAKTRRRFILIGLAAALLGVMSFARFNVAPLVAVYGAGFLFWRHISWRGRLLLFVMVGAISGGILGAYLLLIHIPSTGTTTLSCTAGATQLASLPLKGFELRQSNGPHSRRYAELLTLDAGRPVTFHSDTYPLWRNPGPWVSKAEREAFLAQPIGEPSENIEIVFPAALYWHMGPCAADALLYDVYFETIEKQPLKLLGENLRLVALNLMQSQAGAIFPLQYLDAAAAITWTDGDSLGFYRAESARFNGHRVWRPGVVVYSALFPLLQLCKLLTPFAIVWALWRRDAILSLAAVMLPLGLGLITLAAAVEPRYYASLAPLYPLLAGGFVAAGVDRLRANISGLSESSQ